MISKKETNWKKLFFQILFVWIFTLSVSLWVLRDIHKSLDEIDNQMNNQIITELQSRSWVPYEWVSNLIPHKLKKVKKEKEK